MDEDGKSEREKFEAESTKGNDYIDALAEVTS